MIAYSRQEMERFRKEIRKCRKSPGYFLDTYGQIYDAVSGEWTPFRLWSAQFATLQTVKDKSLVVILKARQLGLTWLVLGFALWLEGNRDATLHKRPCVRAVPQWPPALERSRGRCAPAGERNRLEPGQ